MRILGLSGSLRKASFNRALLMAAGRLMPDGAELEVASIEAVPLYNGDLEAAEGSPESVVELKERIAAADGLLLATPEYNGSIPGVFKNAIDWLSRPPADIPKVFGDKPVALMGATPGPGGTALAQAAWLPVLRNLRTRLWFGSQLRVSRAHTVFNEDGELVDEDLEKRLGAFVAGFVEFARRS